MDQLDLIDFYRTFHPKSMNFTFFSSAHGTLSRIDHILGHISSLGKFRKNWNHSSIFSDHSAIRLDVSYKKRTIKNTNIWGLNNLLLITKKHGRNQKGNKNVHRNKWKWKHTNLKPMGFSKSSAKKKVHGNASLSQEKREISNK